jgi:acyl-CoA synthetase (AMP-forming)/AMP-acid ligase II
MWRSLLALIRFIIRLFRHLLYPFIHPRQFCAVLSRNVRGTREYGLAAYQVAKIARQRLTVGAAFERQVARCPRSLCLSYGCCEQPELYTYQDVYACAQRVACWMLQWPVSEGECVSLLMSNRPEFIATWLGAHYAGASAALINSNLRGHALHHSIQSVNSSKLVAGEEFRSVVEEAVSQGFLQGVTTRYVGRYMTVPPPPTPAGSQCSAPQPSPTPASTWDAVIAAAVVSSTAQELKLRSSRINSRSTLYYIFTSGTTGLPKAAAIPNSRFLAAGYGFSALSSLRARDKVYCCLPIYHSSGGMLGVSMVWSVGASMHLSPKFSASRFWTECRQHKCSVIQYVGELLRYLTAQPPSSEDRLHGVAMAIGNGLRPNVWADFNVRFGVARVCEFYGSTEGNITLVNTMNQVGAVGFIPLPMRFGWWNSWLSLAETFAP